MKINNKIIAGIVSMIMVFSLTACADGTGSDIDDNTDAASSVTTEPVGADKPSGIQEQPKNADIELLAEDAFLTSDNYMILEPDSPPYNIGGWVNYGSAVWFDVDIPVSGLYEFGLYYSRAYTEAIIEGTIEFQCGTEEIQKITFDVSEPTSADAGDWSVYTYKKVAECEMEAGLYTIGIYPGSEEHEMPSNEFFINLRSIMLTAI